MIFARKSIVSPQFFHYAKLQIYTCLPLVYAGIVCHSTEFTSGRNQILSLSLSLSSLSPSPFISHTLEIDCSMNMSSMGDRIWWYYVNMISRFIILGHHSWTQYPIYHWYLPYLIISIHIYMYACIGFYFFFGWFPPIHSSTLHQSNQLEKGMARSGYRLIHLYTLHHWFNDPSSL